MKTYKEYYQFGLGEHFDWKSKQKEEWWKKGDQSSLEPKGDYIETVKFLSVDEKNDASLFVKPWWIGVWRMLTIKTFGLLISRLKDMLRMVKTYIFQHSR